MTNILDHAIHRHQEGHFGEANQIYQQILASDPQNADALHYAGVAAMQMGKIDIAITYLEQAIAIRPNIGSFHSNLALAYKDNNQFDKSYEHYQKALALAPDNPILHFNVGALFQSSSRLADASNAYMNSLKYNPNQPLVYHNLGNLLLKQGDVAAAIKTSQKAVEMSPDNAEFVSNYLFSLNYSIDHSPESVLNAHLKWGQTFANTDLPKPIKTVPDRIRVGYVSPDFREHAVAKFIQAILKHHNTERFEIFCYANVKKADHMTEKLKQLPIRWRDIYFLDDQSVCHQIQKDDIHILVDLAGHSASNRLIVFAMQPAPIQVTYLGYPNTTGLRQIQYRLVDQHSDPNLNHFCGSEKRIHLPNGFLCFTPPKNAPRILKKTSPKQITFGSFNNLPKVNMRVIALWSQILKALPESRILIKTKGFNDQIIQEKYLIYFQQYGIHRNRIQLMGEIKGEQGHLDMYNAVDIALDTFPYNGTTTTCEALWMGVPVITLVGVNHVAMVGKSILSQTGLKALIARDENEYIQKAVYLASHPEERANFTHNLRKLMVSSNLCRADFFVEALESVYTSFVKKGDIGSQ